MCHVRSFPIGATLLSTATHSTAVGGATSADAGGRSMPLALAYSFYLSCRSAACLVAARSAPR